jgi:hypothetical protein
MNHHKLTAAGQPIDTEKQGGTPSSTGPVQADNSPGAPSSNKQIGLATVPNPIEPQSMAVLMQGNFYKN